MTHEQVQEKITELETQFIANKGKIAHLEQQNKLIIESMMEVIKGSDEYKSALTNLFNDSIAVNI